MRFLCNAKTKEQDSRGVNGTWDDYSEEAVFRQSSTAAPDCASTRD
jgi:hypothetical protein